MQEELFIGTVKENVMMFEMKGSPLKLKKNRYLEDPNNIVRPKKYLRKYILSKQRLYCNFCDN